MIFFELEPSDISNLSDADLREMVARLCEAELISRCREMGFRQVVVAGRADEPLGVML